MTEAKRRRGRAQPAPMSIQEATRVCREHATVPLTIAAQALGLSTDSAYKAADALGALRIGRKLVVPTAVLARLLRIDTVPEIRNSELAAPSS
jgi:hypothetical protein